MTTTTLSEKWLVMRSDASGEYPAGSGKPLDLREALDVRDFWQGCNALTLPRTGVSAESKRAAFDYYIVPAGLVRGLGKH